MGRHDCDVEVGSFRFEDPKKAEKEESRLISLRYGQLYNSKYVVSSELIVGVAGWMCVVGPLRQGWDMGGVSLIRGGRVFEHDWRILPQATANQLRVNIRLFQLSKPSSAPIKVS